MFNNFMPTPIVNAYQSPMQMYGHGGHVQHNSYPYHHEAEMLRHFGTGQDRILAHINPAEASYLQKHHGMSINPHTGLPQFGFFDSLKSGLGRLGNAAMAAAPSIWENVRPLAQQGLQALDTRIQSALPEVAQAIGTHFGGDRGAQLGESFGRNLASQFSNYGGVTGQMMPKIDQRFGMQSAPAPQFNPMKAAAEVGRGMWNDTGRGMVRQGIQNLDERIMNNLPQMGTRIGTAVGNQLGYGEKGAQLGSRYGNRLSEMYGNSSGIGGQVMPRLNNAIQNFGPSNIPPAPPPPPSMSYPPAPRQGNQSFTQELMSRFPAGAGAGYAHGGHVHNPYYY